MDISELNKYIQVGSLPVGIYCKKEYRGICCVLRITKENTLFLDYDDANTDAVFRATFEYDTFEKMLTSIEQYTGLKLENLKIEFDVTNYLVKNENPDWRSLQWDLYNGKIRFLEDYKSFSIGDLFYKGLYLRRYNPECDEED